MKLSKKRHDFSGLANAHQYESAATSVAVLTRMMVQIIQSGDRKLADDFVRSEPYLAFQEYLRALPEHIEISYVYNCVAAYISALGALSTFSEAERLLDQSTHARYASPDDYLQAMAGTVIAFTEIVGEERSRRQSSGYIGRACAYIDDHLYAPVDLESLAAFCGCSLSHLRHVFKKEMNLSLTQYIQAEKVNKAKEMLKITDYSIAEIAGQLGFCSESYFISVFKKAAGCTPRQFKIRGESEKT